MDLGICRDEFGRNCRYTANDEKERDEPPDAICTHETAPERSRKRVNIAPIPQVCTKEVHRGAKEVETLKQRELGGEEGEEGRGTLDPYYRSQ